IRVLNDVDEMIMSSGGEGRIDLGQYAVSVARRVLAALGERSSSVKLSAHADEVMTNSRHAQAIAVIVNEFITNSFKHALGEDGEISVRVAREGERALLELADNGPGLRPRRDGGLGMRLIEAMTQQLDAAAEWLPGPGARLRLTFDPQPPEA